MIAARARRGCALFVVLLAACTGAEAPKPPGGGPPNATSTPPPEIAVPVIVPTDPAGSEIAAPLLDAMHLAVEDAIAAGDSSLLLDVRETSDSTAEILGAVQGRPPALFVLVDGDEVVAARTDIEASRVPVLLLGHDLYSGRELFRYAFQTSIPVSWQARVLATYLLEDRGEPGVAVLVPEPDQVAEVETAFGTAFSEEGGAPPAVAVVTTETGPRALYEAVGDADAVVALVPPSHAVGIGNALRALADPPRLIIGSASLSHMIGPQLAPGSAVVFPYTWARWAAMLPRVEGFRRSFEARIGRGVGGLEQEAYDAVRALADALARTAGAGGDALVRALEAFRDETYSSLPIRLGPDDHVLAEQSQLGLFAVEAPGTPAPGEALGTVPWRPVMRTFTTDGEKVNILDRDKRVFFPFWHPKRPSPKYWRSRYGIVTRPSDPLH